MTTTNRMTYLKRTIILLIILSLFYGCTIYEKSLNPIDLKTTEKLVIFKGTKTNKYFLLSDGQEISILSSIPQNLFDWFEKNKDGWKKMPSNYASIDLLPPDLVIKNDKFKLSIYKTFTILEFKDSKEKTRIYSRDIENNEFDFLNKLY